MDRQRGYYFIIVINKLIGNQTNALRLLIKPYIDAAMENRFLTPEEEQIVHEKVSKYRQEHPVETEEE